MKIMKTPGRNGGKLSGFFWKPWRTSKNDEHMFYSTSHFHHMLHIERKRAERSKKPFLLMLLDISELDNGQRNGSLEKIKDIVVSCSRETDIRGWYEHGTIMGAIFTEIASVDEGSIETIFQKMHNKIDNTLHAEWAEKVNISLHPIAPSPVLQLLQPNMQAKKREEGTLKETDFFRTPLMYNEGFVC